MSVPASVVPVERVDAYGLQRQSEILAQVSGSTPNVLFLGDSMIGLWNAINWVDWTEKIVPFGVANEGIFGDSTQNLLWRVEHGDLGQGPKVAVVEIGTNNILSDAAGQTLPDVYSQSVVSDTVAGIAAVVSAIRALSPQTQILLMGVFPLGVTPDDPQRLEVDQVNAQIAGLADGTHVRFLDIGSDFLQPDGTRPPTANGIHPTPDEYASWSDAIHDPIQDMLGRPTAPGVLTVRPSLARHQITAVRVHFNEPMDPSTAQSRANYNLLFQRPGLHGQDASIARNNIASAIYNPSTWTVTLKLRHPLRPTGRDLLEITGAPPSGLRDGFGIYLGGDPAGQSGQNLSLTIVP